ncbi:MAG TPA: hypothetical protein VGS10_13980 [Terracidiphilus sp.]|nr:hypothetical protein [Terracidiphilus sp.]
MYQEIYYLAYLGLCASLAVCLARLLRRLRTAFLREAFRENSEAVRSLGRLLELGMYLIGAGYLAVSFPNDSLRSPDQVALAIIGKLGGFLLLLGFVHCFNLLILAIFRQRSLRNARAGDLV